MKIAITGAKGKVAQALIGQLDATQFQITSLDLPEHDARNYDDLLETTKGHDALIHFAWRDISVEASHPDNGVMYENAYRAAVANKISRVIMASSNHARDHNQRESDNKIRYTGQVELANNLYGVEKQKMESMGRFFAKKNGLDVLCVRIGNVNTNDAPLPMTPTRWMSQRDFGSLITHALDKKTQPGQFEVVYGVSDQPVFDWKNSFNYQPKDCSE
ncbi:MAG: NAD(P)-dependent oxidoreductase [Gammaproteobacteria bacterium]|nr:NAD(P)-dependent oxidoreductase [Gammaproteobacteria bacterium]